MMKHLFSALFCAGLLSSAAFAGNSVTRAIPVDDEFAYVKLGINGGTAGGYEGWVKPIVVDGRIELCGVGVITNLQARNAIMKSLRGTTFKINRQLFIKDITYFAKARSPATLKSTKAHCAASGKAAPRKVDSMDLDWGRATFRN